MFETRKTSILGFFYIFGIIYILRLFYLQLLDPKYHSLGALNSIKKEVRIPLRGQIYDKYDRLVVANEEVYDMYVTPKNVKAMNTLGFCSLFNITKGYFDSTLTTAKAYSKNKPSIFKRLLTKEDYASVVDAMNFYPGFSFEQSFFRTYPALTMANSLGYIGEIPEKQYNEQEDEYYRKGDYIGLSGLEKYYEKELRGVRGVSFTLMNVKGEEKGKYASGKYDTSAVVGQNLYTYIDLELQHLADSLFLGKRGAVVAIEPKTGGILAIGSYPSYNPNEMSGRELSKNYRRLANDPDRPLNNRAISSFYRPGSTWKLLQAAIGLQLQVIDPKTSFVGAPSRFVYHHGPGEASNLYTAIQLSSNPYFFNVFKKIIGYPGGENTFKQAEKGLESWRNIVLKFGFGEKLGVDLPYETKGLIPTAERYDKVYGKGQWKFSNIYSLSIGEGELGVNVLKLANMAATIANRGYWITPHIVNIAGISKKEGKKIDVEIHRTGIEAKHWEHVIEGMSRVVRAGTGRRAAVPGIEVCGKTGTSQNKKGGDHAIFIAMAPRYNPKIVIAVVVENAGGGGVASAPIAGKMIQQYIKGDIIPRSLVQRSFRMNKLNKKADSDSTR